jgi:hypothetical protein
MKIHLHQTRRHICLFVYSHMSNFFSYLVAVTIVGDRSANLGLCSALRAFEQGRIFIMPHLLWHGTSVYMVSSERPTHMSHSGIRTLYTRIEVLNLYLITIWICMYMHIYTFYYTIQHCHFRMWCKDWCDSPQSAVQYCWHIWYRTIHPDILSVLWFRMWTPMDTLKL